MCAAEYIADGSRHSRAWESQCGKSIVENGTLNRQASGGTRSMKWLTAGQRFWDGSVSRPQERRAVRSPSRRTRSAPRRVSDGGKATSSEAARGKQMCRFEWRCEARTMARWPTRLRRSDTGTRSGVGVSRHCRVARTMALREWLLAGVSCRHGIMSQPVRRRPSAEPRRRHAAQRRARHMGRHWTDCDGDVDG
jgi:hypothetical protein